jgi:hypothetical protein
VDLALDAADTNIGTDEFVQIAASARIKVALDYLKLVFAQRDWGA